MTKLCTCGKPIENYQNYCSWGCMVTAWREIGAKEHLPNGLPIRCIQATPPMLLECENGAHPDYLFPVNVDYVGPPEDNDCDSAGEFHALIYTDGHVALTLYECSYHLWRLSSNGAELPLVENGQWRVGKYRLSPESLAKVTEWAKTHGKV